MIGGIGLGALRTSLFYLTVIGFGAAVVTSTQVVEVTGPSGFRDRALGLASDVRSRLFPATESAPLPTPDDRPGVQDVPLAAAPLPFEPQAKAVPDLPDACRTGGPVPDPVVIGDQLRLRFFERAVAAVLPGGPATTAAERTIVFERLDLSGSFQVAADGTVSVPLLGRVHVADADLACAEAATRLAYFAALQTPATVTASFDARPQVLVKGAVRAPGTYSFTPGLTVDRLLAAAGAVGDGEIEAAATQAALVQRRNDLLNLQAQKLGLQLKQRRLEAAADGAPEIRLDAREREQVLRLLGPERLQAERSALRAELEEAMALEAQKQAGLSDLSARIADLESQVSLANAQLDELAQRRDELQRFKERGFVLAQQLDGTVFNIMVSERFQRGVKASLLTLQSEARLAREGLVAAKAQRQRELAMQIRDAAEAANQIEAQLRTVRSDLALLDPTAAGSDTGVMLELVIIRPTEAGPVDLPAETTTRLLPGDLLSVTVRAAPELAGADRRISDLGEGLLPTGALARE